MLDELALGETMPGEIVPCELFILEEGEPPDLDLLPDAPETYGVVPC